MPEASDRTGELIERDLTADDASDFAAFECRIFRQPWTDAVEDLVRTKLADALALGEVQGVGLWSGGGLVGIAAWQHLPGPPPTCRSIIVAVQLGWHRHGVARRLKELTISYGQQARAAAVTSKVHWDNEAMLRINRSLGANIERIPGDDEYCLCVIPLNPRA